MDAFQTIIFLYGFGFIAAMTIATMMMKGSNNRGKFSV